MRTVLRTIACIAVFNTLQEAQSARILAFFPSFSPSHHFVLRPLIEALADKGHHVTYVTAFEWENCPTNIDQRFVNIDREEFYLTGERRIKKPDKDIPIEKLILDMMQSPIQKVKIYSAFFKVVVEAMLKHPSVQQLIHSDEQFDLILSETLRGQEAYSALAHKFNAPSVTLLMRGDNSWPNELIGLPDNPSYMVDASSFYTDHMNFWERLDNAYSTFACKVINYIHLKENQRLADKYMNYPGWETRPPLLELARDQALVLVNSHHSVGYAYPKAPHVKEIGGMHIRPPQPIPEDIERRISSDHNGVVYFSMGTNVDFGSKGNSYENLKQSFLNAFSKRKELVLWKVKKFVRTSENLLTSSWFPQADILAHNKTKLFITHGGLLSLMEAARYGIPVIGIPFFGDQKKNIQQAVESGTGIMLDIWNVSEASVSWAISEVLDQPKYKENAMRISRIFPDRSMQPVDEAAYWVEYVLRHGKVLQPASVRMPFYQLYLLDVLGFVVVCAISSLWVVRKMGRWMWARLRGEMKVTAAKKHQ